jgi:hypothetical protein
MTSPLGQVPRRRRAKPAADGSAVGWKRARDRLAIFDALSLRLSRLDIWQPLKSQKGRMLGSPLVSVADFLGLIYVKASASRRLSFRIISTTLADLLMPLFFTQTRVESFAAV